MSDTLLGAGNIKGNKTFLIPNVTSTTQKVIEISVMHNRKINQT